MRTNDGLYFDDSGGEALPLLLLHYFGSDGGTWQALQDELCATFRCITPHLRGFGKSSGVAGQFSVNEYSNDLVRLAEHLELERFAIVGHSMGGKIAQAVAAMAPAGLQSVVLLAPSPPVPEPMTDEARHELRSMYGDPAKIEKHLRKLCAQAIAPELLDAEKIRHLQAARAAWDAWLDQGSREDITDRMAGVQVPVLVVGGAQDEGITPDVIRDVAGWIKTATHEVLPDSGHLLPLEHPQRIAARIRDWVRVA